MPLTIASKPRSFPQPSFLTLNTWKRGVITLIDRSRLPKDALEEADNIFLYEDGQPGPRPGVAWYGSAPGLVAKGASSSQSPSASLSPSSSRSPSASVSLSLSPSSSRSPSASASFSPSASRSPSASQSMSPSASRSPSSSRSPSASASASSSHSVSASPSAGNAAEIDGFDYFDNNGTISLVVAAGGTIYRSLNDGATWSACVGASYTAGQTVSMNQNGSYMYITTGVNNIIRFNGTLTLVTYTALTTPAAPGVAETGLAGSGYNYYYKQAAVNTVGFSIASVASVVVSTSVPRESWDSTTNFAVVTPAVFQATQTRADLYISDNDVDYYYLSSTTITGGTFKDDGTAIPVPGTSAPIENTTQGPRVEELVNVGSRMYGVRDHSNRYRIWFTGAGPFAGYFASAYDGGYLDWQTGGKYIPKKVEDYRDGKGTPFATIWCDSADGQGCIIQMSLDTLTIGDISITVPSAYKLPGSRGTPAPGSVVNVLNDYFFYNSQAFYNLGSRAQFLNLLSTDEASANIRPTVRQISNAGESGIASAYHFARIYFSVPYGASENNFTAVYDTERKAWLPRAFTIGFKKFLRYTDTSGTPRLLALKPGDSMLSEINESTQGDYGEAFSTSLVTGLYPTTRDRFDFQYVEKGQIELSNPQGEINTELLGIERSRGFSSTKTETITATLTTQGWDTFAWDTTDWDDTSVVPDTFSESSVKRYFTVLKELNAVQWRITTNSLDAKYVLRTLQTAGTPTQAGEPRQWRLT